MRLDSRPVPNPSGTNRRLRANTTTVFLVGLALVSVSLLGLAVMQLFGDEADVGDAPHEQRTIGIAESRPRTELSGADPRYTSEGFEAVGTRADSQLAFRGRPGAGERGPRSTLDGDTPRRESETSGRRRMGESDGYSAGGGSDGRPARSADSSRPRGAGREANSVDQAAAVGDGATEDDDPRFESPGYIEVRYVFEGSEAYEIGIVPGDRITRIGDTVIRGHDDLAKQPRDGSSVTLHVDPGDRVYTVKAPFCCFVAPP